MTRAISPLRQRMIEDMRMRNVLAQDPGRVYPCRAAVYRIPGPLTRHRQRRGSAPLSIAPGGAGYLADLAQRDHHRTEVVGGEIVIKQQSESETDPGSAAAKHSDHAWQGQGKVRRRAARA